MRGNTLRAKWTAASTAAHSNDRTPILVTEKNLVSRVNQVRILDMRIDLPDFGPQPRLVEKSPGDVPQGIAFLDNIAVRVIGFEARNLASRPHRPNQCAKNQRDERIAQARNHGNPR